MSDVTLHVKNIAHLTVEDRLLIKRLGKLKKAGLLKKIIVEFPATQSVANDGVLSFVYFFSRPLCT